ncbi:MAG: multidrug transporter ATP-binding protein [Bacilli bacterium]|nr:multidrug transporter ATP-binding protein [Bacilli bacterium]
MDTDPNSRTNSRLIKRYLQFVLQYRINIMIIIGIGFVQFVVPMAGPMITKRMIDQVLVNKPGWSLTEIVIVLGCLNMFGNAMNFFRNRVTVRLGNQMVVDLRKQLYAHLQKLSSRFYDNRQVGSVVSRIMNDVGGAQNLVNSGVINLLVDMFLVIFAGFMLFHLQPRLALSALWILPLYYLTFTNMNVRIRFAWRSVHRQMERISGVLVERIAGMKIVQSFNREKAEMDRFDKQAKHHFEYQTSAQTLSNTLGRFSQMFNDTGNLIVWFLGGTLVLHHQMTIGGLMAFQAYLGQLYGPIQRFSDTNVVVQNSLSNIERIFEVFDNEPEIQNKPNARPLPHCSGDIVFQDVTFTYVSERPETRKQDFKGGDPDIIERFKPDKPFYVVPPRMRPDPPPMIVEKRLALKNISFHARPGEVIALVGPSGAGKSTFINMIPRFYDPDQGQILLDDVDIRDYNVFDLRSHIALVLQDNILFSGSVFDNIAYGRPEATEEEVHAASKAANAHDFVMEWDQQYETVLGERGVRLSGGQKQRIAIARALLKNPRILILDEATSALDAESEELVTTALERLMQGRTTFVIAHRLATIVRANQILVMNRGEVVEKGTHAELLRLNGLYRDLYEKQLKAMRPEDLTAVISMMTKGEKTMPKGEKRVSTS